MDDKTLVAAVTQIMSLLSVIDNVTLTREAPYEDRFTVVVTHNQEIFGDGDTFQLNSTFTILPSGEIIDHDAR